MVATASMVFIRKVALCMYHDVYLDKLASAVILFSLESEDFFFFLNRRFAKQEVSLDWSFNEPYLSNMCFYANRPADRC